MVIFFDIDNTLLDNARAEWLAAEAFQRDHSEFIPESTQEFVARWKRVTETHIQRYLKGELTFQGQRRARLQDIFNRYRKIDDDEADILFTCYLKHYEENWRLFPDVKPCLKDLSGITLGIISNGDSEQQRQKLTSLDISDCFDNVVISGDIGISKPDPGIFLAACKAANESPEACWYVGDNFRTDILGSCQVGMRGVWLNRGGNESAVGDSFVTISSLAGLKDVAKSDYR